ncbi:hypothetical protein K435DRAFT_776655 [Dendrothele bispora CBS 962.96]|uniref:Uncharacterized protein n=1 Tax=Dendrothele bispora (strain CBS 962.96) TaxID=1314807 RepID=A0A4S8MCP5_DENBC|nr:hypothetical protein K435DRAFT_776655 [Dendrothele bispora CBS 962.96]
MSLPSRSGFKLVDQGSSTESLQDDYVQAYPSKLEPDGAADEKSRSERPVKWRHPAFDIMRISCVLVHVALTAFLLVLVVHPFPPGQRLNGDTVFFTQFKVHAENSTDTQNFLRSYAADLIVSKQKPIFGALVNGYCIILVLTTQRLTLRRQLHISNSLTTKHDTVSAWSGLGAAWTTIFGWRQIGLRTSLTTTFIATAYLTGIFFFSDTCWKHGHILLIRSETQ